MSTSLPQYFRAKDGSLEPFPTVERQDSYVLWLGKRAAVGNENPRAKWPLWYSGQETRADEITTQTGFHPLVVNHPVVACGVRRDRSSLVDAELVARIIAAQEQFSGSQVVESEVGRAVGEEIRKRIFSALADVARLAASNGVNSILLAKMAGMSVASWVDDEFAIRLAIDMNIPIVSIGDIAKLVGGKLWVIAQDAPIRRSWGCLVSSGRELSLAVEKIEPENFDSWPE